MKKHVVSSSILLGKIVALLLSGATAFAVVGPDYIKVQSGNDATCRITNRDADGKLLGICSGSLVAENRVLTAAHCSLENQKTIVVECGFRGTFPEKLSLEYTAKGTPVYTRGVRFLEATTGSFLYVDRNHDQAIIHLNRNLNIKPLPVRPEYQIQASDSCHLEGYGRTNDTTAGILYSGPLVAVGPTEDPDQLADAAHVVVRKAPGQVSAFVDIYELTETAFVTNGMNAVIGRRGDSGGPLICRTGDKKYVGAVWTQILRKSPRDPVFRNTDPAHIELALHISFSRIIKLQTMSYIFVKL